MRIVWVNPSFLHYRVPVYATEGHEWSEISESFESTGLEYVAAFLPGDLDGYFTCELCGEPFDGDTAENWKED